MLVPGDGELHERVSGEVGEVQICCCVDLLRCEGSEKIVQYLVASVVDCSVEEVSLGFVVEVNLDEVKIDEELETFKAIRSAVICHGVLSVNLGSLRVGLGEWNVPMNNNAISNHPQESLDMLMLKPCIDILTKCLAGRSHHMKGMNAGTGKMRVFSSNEKQSVENLMEYLGWN